MIDLTGVDLVDLVKAAYDLSVPQGMGVIHFTPEALTDEEASVLLSRESGSRSVALSLDYVKGRAVKLTVWRDGETLTTRDEWFDHSPEQFRELLDRVGCRAQPVSAASPEIA